MLAQTPIAFAQGSDHLQTRYKMTMIASVNSRSRLQMSHVITAGKIAILRSILLWLTQWTRCIKQLLTG